MADAEECRCEKHRLGCFKMSILYAPTFTANRISLTEHGLENELCQEQISCLCNAGVDLLVAETMLTLEETMAAVEAAHAVCELPLLCSMTIEASSLAEISLKRPWRCGRSARTPWSSTAPQGRINSSPSLPP